MTEEVIEVTLDELEEEKTEVDWAMDYANERKLRLEVEKRYKALLYNTVPMMVSAHEFRKAIVHNKQLESAKAFANLTKMEAELSIFVHMELLFSLDPARTFTHEFLVKIQSEQDLPKNCVNEFRDSLQPSDKWFKEDWDKKAEIYGFGSHDEYLERAKREAIEQLAEMLTGLKALHDENKKAEKD